MKTRTSRERADVTAASPPGIPVLGRGAHLRPEWGACLMEYVSVLAGERFSDAPRCTHPALAALARRVNDRTDDQEARSRLALLAPDLVGTRRTDARVTATVVAACLEEAAQNRSLSWFATKRLASARTLAARPARRGPVERWACLAREAVRPPGVVVRWAFDTMARQWPSRPDPDRDRQLGDLLARVVADCKALDATPQPVQAVRTG